MYQAIVTERGHEYSVQSSDKARVISFVEWMLDGLTGNAVVTVNYRQTEDPIQPPKAQ